jgi:hypothetical protein
MPEETTSTEAAGAAGRTLRDPNASTDAKTAAASALTQARNKGLTEPFTEKKDLDREGVDSETGLFHGIDPDSNERVTVTIEGLKAEFGEKQGEQKYLKIAGIAGGSVFFNPPTEATSYRPPLGISKLSKKYRDEVDKILVEKE